MIKRPETMEGCEIEIPCPSCGQNVVLTVGQVKNSETVSCLCGQKIEIDGTGVAAALKPTEDSLEKLSEGFSKLQ
jgi:transcription elongation factor Elf1